MNTNAAMPLGKYEFLLALNLGESHTFENMPTRSEAVRKVNPSDRLAYKRVARGVGDLRRRFPDHAFRVSLGDSKGSRIAGNLVVVTLLARGGNVFDAEAFDRTEAHRRQALESWKRRKQEEDAPKLPEQLAQAECADVARRTAGAIRAQEEGRLRVIANRYDPKKIAELVTAYLRGEPIERLIDGIWYADHNPTWTEPTGHYRIKPKIREWFLVLGRDGRVTAGSETIEALPHHDPDCRVRVRELIGEEE